MKNSFIILAVIAILGGGTFYYSQSQDSTNEGAIAPSENLDRRMATPQKQSAPQVPERFTGKLQEVNTGCFADGECFVTIDGKHVTTTWGWTQEIVGSVKDVEGFGDLEQHIGKQIEVYANKLENGDYTLYGNASYFIEMKG